MKKSIQLAAFSAAAFCALLCNLAPTANAGVFSFGSNSSGATGLGPVFEDTYIATPIVTTNLIDHKIVQVVVGAGVSLMVGDDGIVFSCGSNGSGQLGQGVFNGTFRIATPIVTTNLTGRTIIQVASAGNHSLLLADDGSVFSMGGSGGLGLGSGVTTVNIATPIDSTNLGGRKIAQIAAGGHHSLLLADDGSVFSMGLNFSGQTGLGTTTGHAWIATPIDATNLGGRKISQVAAGEEFSLLLADDGSVFSFGSNSSGQLGLGTPGSRSIATPIDVTNLVGLKITQIAADYQQSLLLADDGSVFSFGNNSWGQLGLGTSGGYADVATPIDTTNLAGLTITEISVGRLHSLIKTEDGRAFSFGNNFDGQLGLGTTGGIVPAPTPINTTNLGGQVISQLAAGDFFSLLLTEPALPGDFNHDGAVDAADLAQWQGDFGVNSDSDADADHDSDGTDFLAWQRQLGGGSSTPTSSAAVPEPATLATLLLGITQFIPRRMLVSKAYGAATKPLC